jgi:cytochrome c biogenesis protein CcdA
MANWLIGGLSALWLGLLTSISPCPLATNLTAISYISHKVGSSRQVFFAGTLYTLGRALTYVVLGALLVFGLLSAPHTSLTLQRVMNKVLGPLLILVGMVLLDLLHVNISVGAIGKRAQQWADTWGIWGAFPLGALFALTFCPVSATLFFGSLIPLSIREGSVVRLPLLYGVGTALPVFGFAVLMTTGARTLSTVFNRLTQVERWARRATGVVFICVGIYLCLIHIYKIAS